MKNIISRTGSGILTFMILFSICSCTSQAADKPAGPQKLEFTYYEGGGESGYTFHWDDVPRAGIYEYRYAPDWKKGMVKDGYTYGETKDTIVSIPISEAALIKFQVRAVISQDKMVRRSKWSAIKVFGIDIPVCTGASSVNNEVLETDISYEDAVRFREAVKGSFAEDDPCEPVAVIGQQTVSGMNYLYLTRQTINYSDGNTPDTYWHITEVYQPLSGAAKLQGSRLIETDDLKTVMAAEQNPSAGGWTPVEPVKGLRLPLDAQTAFDKLCAKKEMPGVSYKPIALLSRKRDDKKHVSYFILAHGAADPKVYPDSDPSYRSAICILCIQMNMNGEVTASSSETVDLGAYASSY